MKFWGLIIILAALVSGVFAQSIDVSHKSDEPKIPKALLGEDTVICLDDPKKDTVYTIDDQVMDVKPDKVALGEMYYPVAKDVVVVDVSGNKISYEMLPIRAMVRARLVKVDDDKFVIKRIRVLKNPE